MLKYLKNKNGWAMVLVLIIIIVIPILGTTLYMYSSSAMNYAQKYKHIEQARYLARSGAEAVMTKWKESIEKGEPFKYTSIDTVYYYADGTFSLDASIDEMEHIGEINVTISEGDVTDSYKIFATGEIHGATQTFSIRTTTAVVVANNNSIGWFTETSQSSPLPFNDIDQTTLHIAEGVITVARHTDYSSYGFTVSDNTTVKLVADAIFFEDSINIFDSEDTSSGDKTTLGVDAKTIVFNSDIELGYVKKVYEDGTDRESEYLQYSTVIVNGEMVYFSEKVNITKVTITVKKKNTLTKIKHDDINAGSYYINGGVIGVDLVDYSESSDDRLEEMDTNDDNKVVPTEIYITEFIYE